MTHLLKSCVTAQYLQDTFYLYLLWTGVMCVGVSIQVCGHTHLCVRIVWRPEVDFKYLLHLLSILFAEMGLSLKLLVCLVALRDPSASALPALDFQALTGASSPLHGCCVSRLRSSCLASELGQGAGA